MTMARRGPSGLSYWSAARWTVSGVTVVGMRTDSTALGRASPGTGETMASNHLFGKRFCSPE